jgi:hypothetical protein
MGRYSNQFKRTRGDLHLHSLTETDIVPLKVCTICGKGALTEAELELFIISGTKGERSKYCIPCFNSHYNLPNNAIRQSIGNKKILVAEPRTGFCRKCGAPIPNQNSDMHHWRYDLNNPNAFCIELCDKCHGYENCMLVHHNADVYMIFNRINLTEFFTDVPFDLVGYLTKLENEWDARYTDMLLKEVNYK